jgi:hypothetical protein
MAHFYGTVKDARGEASRLGHKGSGMTTVAASWYGAVEVELRHTDDGRDEYRVVERPWRGSGTNRVICDWRSFNGA